MNHQIIELRQELHKYPEISNNEYKTAERIEKFINHYKPDECIRLGNTGLAFVFKGALDGKITVFRAELDALPIKERSNLPYSSVNDNVAHACGHDGHSAILAGLAQVIASNPPQRGRAILLFQPAEEVEQGARDVINNPKFSELNPDYMFALHNVPGIEKNKVLLKSSSFASASKGMTIRLFGKTSHAAEPQNGISPADAISQIIKKFHELREDKSAFNDFILLTIIHILMGEISFGTSPGYAEVRVTLRAFQNSDMELLTSKCESIIDSVSAIDKLRYEISYSEVFPATVNSDECLGMVEQSAIDSGLDIEYLDQPFRWSEDFGYYSENYKTCYFGLGSGINQAQLHNPDFDFPDDILEAGIKVFSNIYKQINC